MIIQPVSWEQLYMYTYFLPVVIEHILVVYYWLLVIQCKFDFFDSSLTVYSFLSLLNVKTHIKYPVNNVK